MTKIMETAQYPDPVGEGGGGGEGDTQIWFGQGCVAQASNPYPSLRVILAERGTNC